MAITEKQAVRALQTGDSLFVAYSQTTKLPYVTCDEESFNDQVWIFSTEEKLKEFAKERMEEKIPLMGMRYDKKDFTKLYGVLYGIGVNSVLWHDGGDQIEVELPKIAKQTDMSKVEPAKRPLLNPTLQLSGIYFMQEVRRPVPMEEKQNVHELEEELLANLCKAEFLIVMEVNAEDPKKINIPYLKNKDGKILQPVFTDVLELQKFTKGKKYRVAKLPFSKLLPLLIKEAEAFVVNPMGFNLPLNREQMEKLTKIAN
ncbi:MAG: SseB family protein [Clostridiales bacterium]|nr:SseB family protein [Clostridiales bacterium]